MHFSNNLIRNYAHFLFVICLLIFCFPMRSIKAEVMGGSATSTITKPTTLNVVLVEFNDVKWDTYYDSSTSQWKDFIHTHELEDFEDMLTTLESYTGTNCVEKMCMEVFGIISGICQNILIP